MVHAKNYETVSTLVNVMQKKLWPLFFRTQCISAFVICSGNYTAHIVVNCVINCVVWTTGRASSNSQKFAFRV